MLLGNVVSRCAAILMAVLKRWNSEPCIDVTWMSVCKKGEEYASLPLCPLDCLYFPNLWFQAYRKVDMGVMNWKKNTRFPIHQPFCYTCFIALALFSECSKGCCRSWQLVPDHFRCLSWELAFSLVLHVGESALTPRPHGRVMPHALSSAARSAAVDSAHGFFHGSVPPLLGLALPAAFCFPSITFFAFSTEPCVLMMPRSKTALVSSFLPLAIS